MCTRMSASPRILWMLPPLLLGWTLTTQAAKFDERISAPRVVSPEDLEARTRDYFATYERARAAGVGGVTGDRAAHQQWADLEWRLSNALDERQPIGDLTRYGLIPHEDGSYTINLRQYPQWAPLDSMLAVLRTPGIFEAYAPELKSRGFRDQDLAALKSYVDRNNPERAALDENKPLAESFAVKVQALQRTRRPLERASLNAYFYQSKRNVDETRRQWALGLLQALDPQRQRILASYFEELEVTRTIGPPSVDMDEQVKIATELFTSGRYRQEINKTEFEVRQ